MQLQKESSQKVSTELQIKVDIFTLYTVHASRSADKLLPVNCGQLDRYVCSIWSL